MEVERLNLNTWCVILSLPVMCSLLVLKTKFDLCRILQEWCCTIVVLCKEYHLISVAVILILISSQTLRMQFQSYFKTCLQSCWWLRMKLAVVFTSVSLTSLKPSAFFLVITKVDNWQFGYYILYYKEVHRDFPVKKRSSTDYKICAYLTIHTNLVLVSQVCYFNVQYAFHDKQHPGWPKDFVSVCWARNRGCFLQLKA